MDYNLILHQKGVQLLSRLLFYYFQRSSNEILLLMMTSRELKPKVENYYELTIPAYSLEDFRSHFRLKKSTFEVLVTRLGVFAIYNRSRGPNVNLEKELLMFLWYLGNLESFRSMADRFGVSKSTLHACVKRMSSALVDEAMSDIIKWPRGEKIIETCQQFSEITQLQNVVGAVDGTHIEIKAPSQNTQSYFNRKKFPSIILLGTCNAKLYFTYVWTGNPGSTHDATVLRYSELFQQAEQIIPPGHYVLGDSAFPLQRWLLTPFRNYGNLTRQQKIYNRNLSKGRQVIERAFGLLKCRFRRLLKFDASDMEIIVNSILSACVLHNLCLHEEGELPEFDGNIEHDDDDDQFVANGHELSGIRLRHEVMQQLLPM